MTLPLHLWKLREDIRGHAIEFGLDFFEVVFEQVSNEKVNEIASLGGFPVRYPHWRFGMEYDRMAKSHLYGLHKIYEMVINNDPCYAYLIEGASQIDYKLIMAHVYAHSDFFKNNMWFAHTNRKMMDEVANHATRIRRFVDRHGLDKIESFIDCCLSVDNLIDYHFPGVQRNRARPGEEPETPPDHRFPIDSPDYLEDYLYPKDYVAAHRLKQEEERQRVRKNPAEPVKDIMAFVLQNAPLEDWEREILAIVREESLYFAPQGQTKIMNEGWAAYWHSKILTTRALDSSEIVDFADSHSKATAVYGMNINPYKLGLELFRDIEERWNRGRFGKEFEECRDLRERQLWDRSTDLGRDKIFQVRRIYNDVSFLDEFLTPEFCLEHRLFTWAFKEHFNRRVIDSRKFEEIKSSLLKQITNFGHPIIRVVDANHRNRGELLLQHTHEGEDLDVKYARDVLRNLQRLWRRPVAIQTRVGTQEQLWRHDGSSFGATDLKGARIGAEAEEEDE